MRYPFALVLALAAIVTTTLPTPVHAQEAEANASSSATIEGYYTVKWGSFDEFIALYQKNHLPILEEAKARGIITELRMDVPYTHLAGDVRWDLRVTMTYRSPDAALLADPELTAVFDEVVARLKAENPKYDEEEARRFSLLEEHWDVVVMPIF